MNNKCLYCYQPIKSGHDFHDKCSLEFFGTSKPPVIEYTLSQIDELAKKVVERSISIPGVQPKISLSHVKDAKEKAGSRLTFFDAIGGMYIFKPPADRYPEMPANEHVTMRMAESFGIRVVPSSLIRLASGELAYITKRIDRTEKGEKIHMIDMFQITEAYDKYRSSMEKVGKSLRKYSDNTLLDTIFFYELTLFSFLSGNNDMHLKNFSMIESPSGWVLAPAYDLLNASILNPEDQEELALTLHGKRKNLKREHFIQLGKDLGLTDKQIKSTFERIQNSIITSINLLDISFLSKEMILLYRKMFKERYTKLGLNEL